MEERNKLIKLKESQIQLREYLQNDYDREIQLALDENAEIIMIKEKLIIDIESKLKDLSNSMVPIFDRGSDFQSDETLPEVVQPSNVAVRCDEGCDTATMGFYI